MHGGAGGQGAGDSGERDGKYSYLCGHNFLSNRRLSALFEIFTTMARPK